MDLIRDNVTTLRDSIQRNQFSETTALDVLTALHVVYQKRIMDYSVSDDKHFAFILGCLRNVPAGSQRKYWLKTMFNTYEKISNIDVNDPNWLLLQANLVYLSPVRHSTPLSMPRGTLYVCANEADRGLNVYKIGMTKNLKRRLRAYRTYWPLGYSLKYSISCSDGRTAERLVLKRLKEYRYGTVAQEFVQCDLGRIRNVIDEVVDNIRSATRSQVRKSGEGPVTKWRVTASRISDSDDEGDDSYDEDMETDNDSDDPDYSP